MIVVHAAGRRYLPLELLRDDTSCLDKADVFALGASMLELATARPLPSGEPLSAPGHMDEMLFAAPLLHLQDGTETCCSAACKGLAELCCALA